MTILTRIGAGLLAHDLPRRRCGGADRAEPLVPRRRQRGGAQHPQRDRRRLQRLAGRLEGGDRAVPAGGLQRLGHRGGAVGRPAGHPRRGRADHAELGLGRLSRAARPSTRRSSTASCPASIGKWNDQLYSVGFWDAALAIFARKSVLEENGIRIPTLDEPWTGTSSTRSSSTLKDTGKYEYPLNIGMADKGEWYPYAFLPFLQSFGGDLVDRVDLPDRRGRAERRRGDRVGRVVAGPRPATGWRRAPRRAWPTTRTASPTASTR